LGCRHELHARHRRHACPAAEPRRFVPGPDEGVRHAGRVIDPSIFKAYDVRGVYPDQIDEELAYRIGRGFARVLGELEGKPPAGLQVGLGHDMRLTAPALAARYAGGLRDEGADVVDVGMVATEVLY